MCALFVHIKLHDYVPEEFEAFANALVNPIDYVQSQSRKEELLRTYFEENDLAHDPQVFANLLTKSKHLDVMPTLSADLKKSANLKFSSQLNLNVFILIFYFEILICGQFIKIFAF